MAYDIGRNYDPAVHDRCALEWEYWCVFASNVVNTQSTLHGAMRTLTEIAWVSADGTAVFNMPDSPRKCAEVDPLWVGRVAGMLWAEVDAVRYSGGVYWIARGALTRYAWNMMHRVGPLTLEEIAACNIRPAGAVGGQAVVPKVVARMLGLTPSLGRQEEVAA